MNEEHGYVEIDGKPVVGEKVWVVPSHCCATVNLHDEIWYGRRSRVAGSWKVAARGRYARILVPTWFVAAWINLRLT